METIEEAIRKTIPRWGDCNSCPHKFKDTCDITEEQIGSGDTYCDCSEVEFVNLDEEKNL